MILASDFEDYYDRALTLGAFKDRSIDHQALADRMQAFTLSRIRGNAPHSRRAAFRTLEAMGWKVVPNGRTCEVAEEIRHKYGERRFAVVVYRRDHEHGVAASGDDPLVIAPIDGVVEQWPDAYCSFYLPHFDAQDSGQHITSRSYVAIGRRRFLVHYRQSETFGGKDTWASNRGVFTAQLIQELPAQDYGQMMPYPIWSIDFIAPRVALFGAPVQLPLAFDLNTAPIIMGTGIESVLSEEDAAELITDAAAYYHDTMPTTSHHDEEYQDE